MSSLGDSPDLCEIPKGVLFFLECSRPKYPEKKILYMYIYIFRKFFFIGKLDMQLVGLERTTPLSTFYSYKGMRCNLS